MRTWLCLTASLVVAGRAPAQDSTRATGDTVTRDTTHGRSPRPPAVLSPVRVTVSRDVPRPPIDLPYAISVAHPDTTRPAQSHTRLDETLLLLPGVTVENRFNPSEDPRIAVRGFGSRSAFGVRDVRLLYDDMPLTAPDGQTPVDYLDMQDIGTVEVIRGTASALYGNGAGGVIAFHSLPAPDVPAQASVESVTGSAGLERWVGTVAGTTAGATYRADIAHTGLTGYRQYSAQQVTNYSARSTLDLGATRLGLVVLGLDEPTADNPGALTVAQYRANIDSAAPIDISKRARKAVDHLQVGLDATHPLGSQGGTITGELYGLGRRLENPLSYATVAVATASGGGSVRATLPVPIGRLMDRVNAGVDYQRQDDSRQNYANCNGLVAPTARCPVTGVDRGVATINQREVIWSLGPYLSDELDLGRVHVSGGLRDDDVNFAVHDELPITPTSPNASGIRDLHAVSPTGGVVVKLSTFQSVYANVASAFETPTTTELGTKPDGTPGINPALSPEYATTYEAGVKGYLWTRIRYDAAAFDTFVRDELVPYEVPGQSTRVYYRNAGRTNRQGLEASLGSTVGPLDLGLSYSYSHFKFASYTVNSASYAGHWIPGIPMHDLQGSATYRVNRLFATLEGAAQSAMFADDANAAPRAPSYGLLNIRAGGSALFGAPWASAAVGITNLLDRHYVPSVVLNATQGEYYEPGALRAIYVKVDLGIGG
jgi:iron complex outermembrane receptor protein